jgi:hypothetical protein
MAIFKCKMCGGNLNVNDNSTVMECEFCGTRQTLPRLSDERRANLYDRANHFRRNNEFDKAMGIYEQILSEDTTDAESYWSIVLCKYGIEYVEDPKTKRRIPTVNRVQYTSIFDDENYKSALKNADREQKLLYEAEAEAINNIQKVYLDISRKESPFDVFICYKETDEHGRRTEDSVLAQDIYDRLTKEGFKVFFARITLEDKLGVAYEPYIFSALNSAKVMIAIGTRPEYLNAVWVKNEWSRYLAMIASGEEKTLIPAYRDMDAYSLPEEFSHLQGQDMAKIGFMQDLVHGVRKLVGTDNNSISSAKGDAANLIKRIVIALEDGEFQEADSLAEQALNLEPENAMLYVYRLMAELNVKNKSDLAALERSFKESNNYKRAVRFADDKLKNELNGYLNAIIERNSEKLFQYALDKYNSARTEDDFRKAAELFEELGDYKNSEDMYEASVSMADNQLNMDMYTHAISKMKAANDERSFKLIAIAFENLGSFRDSREQARICYEKAEACRRDAIYNKAVSLLNNGAFDEASDLFSAVPNWRDADKKALECAEAKKNAEKAREKARKKEKAKRITGILAVIIAIVLVISLIAGAIGYFTVIKPKKTYENALSLLEGGETAKALEILYGLEDYEDSQNIIKAELKKYVARLPYAQSVTGGLNHTAKIKDDGTVSASGVNKEKQCSTSDWKGIIQVDAGQLHTVGLKYDGTVVATGDNKYLQTRTEGWSEIIMISAGAFHTVGLKSDGTVVAIGMTENGQTKVEAWADIVQISAGCYHTVGLRSDGTSIAVGENDYGECESVSGASKVYAGGFHTVYLMADGTVKAVGANTFKQCEVSSWTDVKEISAGKNHTVALKNDGTVVATGDNTYGQCDVSAWTDIVQVHCGYDHTIGVKADGTTVAVGLNEHGQASPSSYTVLVK